MIKYENILKNTKPYQTLLLDKSENRLSHCYMLISDDKLACRALCQMCIRAILCKENGCGECPDCLKVESGNHANMVELEDCKIEAVRSFIDNSFYMASSGIYKVFVIYNVEDIEARVQNLLLKTLEEPSDNVIFILGVTKPSAVLDTIKSRSKKLYLEGLAKDDIEQYFEMQGFEKSQIERMTLCCFGNITKAEALVGDNNFAENYSTMIGILRDMKTSKQILQMLSRMKISDEMLLEYLDILEIIIKAMLDISVGQSNGGFEELAELVKSFNLAMLVNISELINASRKKIVSHCKVEAIAESLLMGILEVKYKCR